MTRTRTPRGMAELAGFQLSSPDTVFGETITPSLFGEDDAPTRGDEEQADTVNRYTAADFPSPALAAQV